jgi:hypothetical protein
MKYLIPIFLFFCTIGHAQNYQCLQGGMKHYFINGNGYLRGTRVDSVRAAGSDIVYYPNRSPRGPYTDPYSLSLDTNGGSWLGKRVVQRADGTFVFDSYWNDSVIVKTQANVGDSWVFYKDTSSIYYQATLTAEDTMTVLSAVDSVKKIMITAYNGAGHLTSDPVDSFVMILSKSNGFVQVFDLFTFPYHKPDSAYRPGLDFFLDVSMHDYNTTFSTGSSGPNANVSLFHVVDFNSPNDQQLHNWDVGDTIEGYHSILIMSVPSLTTLVNTTDYILDVVTNKTTAAHSTSYTLSGIHYTCGGYSGVWGSCYGPCDLIINDGTRAFYDNVYELIDAAIMPEEHLNLNNIIYYFPQDTSFCMSSPLYVRPGRRYGIERNDRATFYKSGLGKIKSGGSNDDPCIMSYEDGLAYINTHGTGCGTLHSLNIGKAIAPKDSLSLFPNPVSAQLAIESSARNIEKVVIYDVLGQIVYQRDAHTAKLQIDVSGFPSGIYVVRVNDIEVRRFVRE